MADEPLVQQLLALRRLLDEVDTRLASAPAAPEGLEDLKCSVDTLRTNMWAILSAGHGTLAQVRVERLKLRRALEGLRAVRASLTAEWAGALHPEHLELQLIARELSDHINKLR
jgi:hypothetical protein